MPKNTASPDPSPAVRQERTFFHDLLPVAGIDSEVILNVIRAGDFLLAELSAHARDNGLSGAQVNVLVSVEDLPEGRTMAQIARRMLVSRAGVWGVVRGLEDKGYVTCRRCPEDARAVRVRITPAGRAVLEAMQPVHQRLVHQLVGDCMAKAEKEDLVRLLTRLREHLADHRTRSAAAPDGPHDPTHA